MMQLHPPGPFGVPKGLSEGDLKKESEGGDVRIKTHVLCPTGRAQIWETFTYMHLSSATLT